MALTEPRSRCNGAWSNVLEWDPVNVRRGNRFQPIEERKLEPSLRILASRLPGASLGVHAVAEFAGSVGVADLVAVTRAESDLKARFEIDVAPLNSLALASVAAAVPVGRVTTASQVATAVGTSEEQATRRLRQLMAEGAIEKTRSGYRRHRALRPVGRMYAFEGKVADWRQAFSQAIRYGQWADATAVVLLHSPKELGIVRDHARQLKVGLAVGEKWLVRPVIQNPNPGARLLASERLVAALAGGR